MSLKSMTGFARTSGHCPPWGWAWELKAVNAKGLDVRLRLPPGFDAIEAEARAKITAKLSRGTVYATLSGQREAATPQVRVNEEVLSSLIAAIEKLPTSDRLQPASLDGLLNVRGVVDVSEATDDESVLAEVGKAALIGLDHALADMLQMRAREGAALQNVLSERVNRIATLTQAAEDCPGRQPEAVKARLQRAIEMIANASSAVDPARLHQEALLLAAKADVREELDRLKAHVDAARELLASKQPAGRKLDFLAQEFAREANTLCSKSNDAALTSIGMELRVEIEQLREQVQNIE
jgi:uncharacterized protein (TIGR00255 family)